MGVRCSKGHEAAFCKGAAGCEVYSVVADAKAWVQTGGADFAIGEFLRSGWVRRAGRRVGREADGEKERGGVWHEVGDVGQGFLAIAD
mgnify:CR=1 FL=1